MKKLLFGIIATVMFSFVGNAQTSKQYVSCVENADYVKLDNLDQKITDFVNSGVASLNGIKLNGSKNYESYRAVISLSVKDDNLSNNIIIEQQSGPTEVDNAQSCMICDFSSGRACFKRIKTILQNGTVVITVEQSGNCVHLTWK